MYVFECTYSLLSIGRRGRTVVGIVEQGVHVKRGERGGRGKRGERDDRGEAMSKRCVLQGRQVHGGVSVGERTRAANRNQDQNP